MQVSSVSDTTTSFKNAFILEKEGDLLKALQQYDLLLKKAPSDLVILSRLMIVARKLKKYSREIAYINKAIKIHELRYARLKTKNVKVATISKKLNSLLGHTDKKGRNLLAIPEVEKLTKRKAIVLKKKK